VKRDHELQRLLLVQVRDGVEPPELKNYQEADQVYNSALLINGGYAEGQAIQGGDGEYVSAVMTTLTSAGHDFLEKHTPRVGKNSEKQATLAKLPNPEAGSGHAADSRANPSSSLFDRNLNRLMSERKWSQSIRGVFMALSRPLRAIWDKGHVARFTIENVTLGLIRHGKEYKDEPAHVAGRWASIAGLTGTELDGLLSEGVWLRTEGSPQTSLEIGIIDPRLELVFQLAEQLARTISQDKIISVRHLAAAILLPPADGGKVGSKCHLPQNVFPAARFAEALIQHIRTATHLRSTDDLGKWEIEIQKLETALAILDQPAHKTADAPIFERGICIGGRTHFSRTAADGEIALGVNGYARILTRLLKAGDDKDLCLAIFGPWGRGKTFLIDKVADELRPNRLTNRKTEYEVVKFSAWRYPSRPEVWIHLYEAFFCALARAGWFRSLAFTILSGIHRHGVTRLWAAWAALMLSAMPKMWLVQRTVQYLSRLEFAVVVATLAFVVIFLLEFWKTTYHLRRHYLSGARHSEKLGLQSTIGQDLKALLKGWVQVDLGSKSIYRGLLLFWGALFGLVGFIIWRSHEVPGVATLFSALTLTPAVIVSLAFRLSAPSPSRILLVVDDLDRCQFEHLLAVMESIKLLLEDEEISSRVQVIMLVEEDVLKHATWEKYKNLVEANAQKAVGTTYDGRRIIRENFDKLFTAHLRLGPLRPSDVADVIFSFGGRSGAEPTQAAPSAAAAHQPSSSYQRTLQAPASGQGSADDDASYGEERQAHDPEPGGERSPPESFKEPKTKLELDTNAAITPHEKQMILAAIKTIYREKQGELGPRALRAIMFRYQLGRLLLDQLGVQGWSPTLFAMMVVERHLKGTLSVAGSENSVDILSRVAEQVA
jgi:hypothetical protein